MKAVILSGCESARNAVPPDTEKLNELCTVTYNDKTYSVSITNLEQGMFSESFILPENIADTVYTFTGEGCDIIRGSLSVHTDRSYLAENSLPRRIYNTFRIIRNTEEPQFAGEDRENGYCIFIIDDYRITTNKTDGKIFRIETNDGSFVIQF